MSVTRRLDAFQRRHRWAGFPLAVVYKFAEDQGPYLAALITYYGFLALFPLLLLLASSQRVNFSIGVRNGSLKARPAGFQNPDLSLESRPFAL